MLQFLTMPVHEVNIPKKKFWEKTVSTYEIITKQQRYVWVLYTGRFSKNISGMVLFDKVKGRKETEEQIVNDFLKLFCGYAAFLNPHFKRFIQTLHKSMVARYEQTEAELERRRRQLQAIQPTTPAFVYSQWEKVLDFIQELHESQVDAINLVATYKDWTDAIFRSHEKQVAGKVIAQFFQDLYKYNEVVNRLNRLYIEHKDIIEEAQDYLVVMKENEAFISITDLLREEAEHLLVIQEYEGLPLIADILKNDFADAVTEPYKKLLR